jgi:hypothetical protein
LFLHSAQKLSDIFKTIHKNNDKKCNQFFCRNENLEATKLISGGITSLSAENVAPLVCKTRMFSINTVADKIQHKQKATDN